MPDFQRLERGRVRPAGEPWVAIHRGGETILFNHQALQLLNTPEAVLLSFDPNLQLIGIQAAQPEEANSYRLRSWKPGYKAIAATTFTRHWRIDTSVPHRFRASMDGPYLILDLKAGQIALVIRRRQIRERSRKERSDGGPPDRAD